MISVDVCDRHVKHSLNFLMYLLTYPLRASWHIRPRVSFSSHPCLGPTLLPPPIHSVLPCTDLGAYIFAKKMLEVIAYGIGGSMWWILSSSVLFPFVLMLKLSKTFRNKFFSVFFEGVVGPLFNHMLSPLRKRVMGLLSEELKKENKSSYEVLEIGIGGGANLAFYPENCVLTALDMNPNFESYFNENKKKYPQVTFKKMIHAMAENMKEVGNETMDIVICTYVMCSVDEIKAVLSEVKRVLKPNGKFLFLEHVAYHRESLNYKLQKLVAPLWRIYFDGCNIDLDIGKEIEKSNFSDLHMEEIYPSNIPLYNRPQLFGLAIK